MFVRQLSSSGFSFASRSRPALSRAGSSYLPRLPPPHPWWSVQGFPPWPPHVPQSRPLGHQVFPGRTFPPWSYNPVNFIGWRSFTSSAGLMMDRPSRDREPPHKRRRSTEDNRSVEGGEGQRGGAARETGGKNGGSRKDSSSDIYPRRNSHFKDGGRRNSESGVSKETSTGTNVKWTRAVDNKDRQRKHTSSHGETPDRGRVSHHQGGHEDSQHVRFWTQSTKSKSEQDKVPSHKPNPWFKYGRSEEQQGSESKTKGQIRSDGNPWMGQTFSPCSVAFAQNPPQPTGADMQPPPVQPSLPVRQWQNVKAEKPLQRHWEKPTGTTDLPPPESSTAFDFSVMSYNILSQELLQDNAYLYRHCNPDFLHWNHRLPNLLAEIQQHSADILCLQEVQEDHYENQIRPALQAQGYQCEYKKRTGSKPDGCAVVFKSSRLSLLSSNPVEFFRLGDALLDRDNVGLVVLLQPNDAANPSDPSSFICIANTHLLYNPRRGDIKLAQLAILLAEVSRMSRLPDGSTNPVVLCGDFNSTPWSPLYSFLTTGVLDYRGLQIGRVSGQETSPRGQRLLSSPIWSHSLGIDHQCQFQNKPPAESSPSSPSVEGAISNLSVADLAAAASNRAMIEHSLKLQSSYQHILNPDGRPEITTCHSRTAMTVDYIFYTPGLTTPSLPGGRGLHLLDRLSLVGQSELEEVNGLPNRFHSSDHLPLLARFRLRH